MGGDRVLRACPKRAGQAMVDKKGGEMAWQELPYNQAR